MTPPTSLENPASTSNQRVVAFHDLPSPRQLLSDVPLGDELANDVEVARRAIAFGMRVVAHDHYISNHALADMVEDDDELFSLADYISIHLPLTPETKGMLDRHAFAKMKDGVVIINTARGKVVVEEDLAEALKSGKVRAYATDVFYSDPPDPSCPLLTAPNVVMTPHIGGSSKENLLRIGDNVVDILKKWKR